MLQFLQFFLKCVTLYFILFLLMLHYQSLLSWQLQYKRHGGRKVSPDGYLHERHSADQVAVDVVTLWHDWLRVYLGKALREAAARNLWTVGLWQLFGYPLVPNHYEGCFTHMVSGSNSLAMELPNNSDVHFNRDLTFSVLWNFTALSVVDVLGAKKPLSSTNETRLYMLGLFTARLVIDLLEARMR